MILQLLIYHDLFQRLQSVRYRSNWNGSLNVEEPYEAPPLLPVVRSLLFRSETFIVTVPIMALLLKLDWV